MMHITSLQNKRVKRLVQIIQKARIRKAERVYIVEGIREVSRALSCGLKPLEIWVRLGAEVDQQILQQCDEVVTCDQDVFEKISYRGSASEILALFRQKEFHLNDLSLPSNPVIVVAESVEKPGNLGAILRTSNALGANAVVVCDPAVDLFNPNVIRNSLGAFFDLPMAVATPSACIDFFKSRDIKMFVTHLEASVNYTVPEYTGGVAIVFGSEATGISDEWLRHSESNIIIPMQGVVDSLNVSVAAAIILAEIQRQRHS
jgi:TrmH family RNA methyltransferase